MKLMSFIFQVLCQVMVHWLANGNPEDRSLKMLGPDYMKVKAYPGEPLVLHCDVFAKGEMDETLIYWLVNGSFPEETPSRDRIVESEESSLLANSILQKSLLLKTVTLEDLKSNFSCVVNNVEKVTQKFIRLKAMTRSLRKKILNIA